MSEYAKPTLYRMSELPSACPPKHQITNAFTLIPKETGAVNYTLFCTEVRPGGEAEMDNHGNREHCYFVLSGHAIAFCSGRQFIMGPGDCLWIPPSADHGLKPLNGETVRFAVVTSPPAWAPALTDEEVKANNYKEATLYRMSDLPSACPPKHIDTNAFTLIGKDTGAKHFVLFCTEVHPGGEAEIDNHGGREHCYFILSGYADVTCAGEKFLMHPGDCLWIPPHADHGLKPVGGQTVRFAVVTSPPAWSPEIK